ncbi:hypothetical protein ACFQ88_09770 [Paenibacillus sp. NPDC056579]|uniref:hypothetical protein n=1 Tax=Paenibacillus sp. NPDC056579 TaxID=3345871 RepID=UPI0036C949AF
MRKAWVAAEWLLLIFVLGGLLLAILPFSDMFHFGRDMKDARNQGIYYPGPGSAERQAYYRSSLQVDGVVYDGGELRLYMTATRLGPSNRLPLQVKLRTDGGALLESSGSGSTNTAIRSQGYYAFKDVPEGIRSATFFYDSFGESFRFDIPLQSGGKP